MKNIAFVTNNLALGGIQKSLINILNIIDYNEYNVDLYLFSDELFYRDILNKNVHIISLNKYFGLFNYLPFRISNAICHKINISKYYDVVINYDPSTFNTTELSLTLNANKYVLYNHNDIKEMNKHSIKMLYHDHITKSKYHKYDTIVSVSDESLNSLKTFIKLKKEYLVIPNIINTTDIQNKCHDKLGIKIDNKKYNLISMGRLTYQKGFDILVYDMKELIKFRKDIHLYILGEGEYKDTLIKLIDKNNLNDYITILDSDDNPYKYLNQMDGYITESRYEGCCISLLEAYTLGLDIIAPVYLTRYLPLKIEVHNNILEYLKTCSKPTKEFHNLNSYNKDIIEKINKLIEK
jgi:glycosyltransferase involved in cell wall biosynthesis